MIQPSSALRSFKKMEKEKKSCLKIRAVTAKKYMIEAATCLGCQRATNYGGHVFTDTFLSREEFFRGVSLCFKVQHKHALKKQQHTFELKQPFHKVCNIINTAINYIN